MNLLQLVEQKGITPKRVSSNKGGEYHSACPACGGEDRFHIWPAQGEAGSFWCRGCDKGGDAVAYLRIYEGRSCGAAYAELGLECTSTTCPKTGSCQRGRGTGERRNSSATPTVRHRKGMDWTPGAAQAPIELWREHAEKFVAAAHEALLASEPTLAYLAGRGLPLEAVQRYRLGWVEKDTYRVRESWGLPAEFREGGKPKKLWLPQGIVIPFYVNGELHRLRIRRDKVQGDEPRYYWVPGSGNDVVVINPTASAFVVIETDLDALMVDFLAGDLVGSVPLGTCSAKPKEAATEVLKRALSILVALDFEPRRNERSGLMENPGGQAARWWCSTFPQARRWPPRKGKDPGEDYAGGVDIRSWILAGLPPVLAMRITGTAGKETSVKQFDHARLAQLVSDTYSRIKSACPSGALEWLDANRPDVVVRLNQVSTAVDAAFAEEDEAELLKVLSTWEKWHLKAWQRYEERPRILER